MLAAFLMLQANTYCLFKGVWVGVGGLQQTSNLGFCNGHTNTTKGLTKFNDHCQIILLSQNNIQQGFIIPVKKCVQIMTTTFDPLQCKMYLL
jgi:hypothetical protein